jgi:hypothetical protein
LLQIIFGTRHGLPHRPATREVIDRSRRMYKSELYDVSGVHLCANLIVETGHLPS